MLNVYLGSFFNVEIWPFRPPMAEKVHYFLMLRYDPTSCPRKDCTKMLDVYVGSFFNVEIWSCHFSKKELHKNVTYIFGNIFQRWKWAPPPMDEKVHYLMLKYDPTSCQRKDWTQMLEVYVGSFFQCWNITPPLVHDKKNIKRIFGIIFQCWNMTPPLAEKKNSLGSFFNVEVWHPPMAEKDCTKMLDVC